ncbi:hypothetical protein GCM10009425_49140 [Pseudomonas asuensis]|uniref:Uncharacterized protein n=1 Tax=Pseudomonas asuensis TaxID=1825787 RepID=A0ABQ2H5G3_9PSED|nr:hypothetical protein GCM10009425_49140 [Pseudomonas asuensis]
MLEMRDHDRLEIPRCCHLKLGTNQFAATLRRAIKGTAFQKYPLSVVLSDILLALLLKKLELLMVWAGRAGLESRVMPSLMKEPLE